MNAPVRENLSGLDMLAEINRLKKERNTGTLAHYYQNPEIQDLADFVGDSLELSRRAAETDADVIAFCGVKFMAETAKILSPQKTVILPDMAAGCSLEDACPPVLLLRAGEKLALAALHSTEEPSAAIAPLKVTPTATGMAAPTVCTLSV